MAPAGRAAFRQVKGGEAVGDAYLHYLAHHPSTATNIARKIATRFVSDNPSSDLIKRLAHVYLTHGTSIRAVVAHDTYTAHQSVEHDDCNILCLGGRVIGPALAGDIIRSYLAAEFTGEDRHKRRLDKIHGIEREFLRDDF